MQMQNFSIVMDKFLVLKSLSVNAIRINIANSSYNSANNNSSSANLLPEYIKEGITIGGITGTKVIPKTGDYVDYIPDSASNYSLPTE